MSGSHGSDARRQQAEALRALMAEQLRRAAYNQQAQQFGGFSGDIDRDTRRYWGQAAQQSAAQEEILRRAREQTFGRRPSRFDTPDVIDLVPDSDGVFRVPAHLEHRVRER